jgi:hypothetical protein
MRVGRQIFTICTVVSTCSVVFVGGGGYRSNLCTRLQQPFPFNRDNSESIIPVCRERNVSVRIGIQYTAIAHLHTAFRYEVRLWVCEN